MLQNVLIFIAIYMFAPPIIISIFAMMKNFAKREFQRKMRVRPQPGPKPQSLMSKVSQSLGFIMKSDKRSTIGIPNKILIMLIYFLGLLGATTFGIMDNLLLFGVFLIAPFVTGGLAIALFRPIKLKRDALYSRLYSLKRDRMGLIDKMKDGQENYSSEFEILEWEDDYVSPSKMKIYLPTRFDSLAETSFIEQLNLHFGGGSKWAPDRSNPEDAGWNYTAGHVTLMHMPPLPTKAMWDEHYLLNDKIAWSFFPLALGVENGVKLYNPETGQDEYVLGYDVAGAQSKMKDVQVGAEVVQAPMVLIAGGTGGGKSLRSTTRVPTVVED
jgi:hypothetical protein